LPSRHPTNAPHDRPTPKQLRYLRALANSRGQTLTYPRTRAQASAEIRRLTRAPGENRVEREVERDRLAREVEIPADASAVRDDEIAGYGANCQWLHSTRASQLPSVE
jgi:hypothetical protein